MAEDGKLTLANVGRGAASELFERELQQVLRNVDDVNTEPEAKREIVLRFIFHPRKDRIAIETDVQVASKLAPVNKFSTTIYHGKDRGQHFAVEHDPKQTVMAFENPATIHAIDGGAKEGA